MKVTAQEEYGLRCILRLAREDTSVSRHGDVPGTTASSLTVGEIAESEGLSVQYAGKLIRILGKAGLVESVRGCKGGYRLARPPGEISVAEALAPLGGRMYEPRVCDRYKGDRQLCVHTGDCSLRSLWSGLQFIVDQVLSGTTLLDLVQSERTMGQWVEASVDAIRASVADGKRFVTPVAHLQVLSKETP
jgi:Rrf2 family protein